jgi:hypothetical protein
MSAEPLFVVEWKIFQGRRIFHALFDRSFWDQKVINLAAQRAKFLAIRIRNLLPSYGGETGKKYFHRKGTRMREGRFFRD